MSESSTYETDRYTFSGPELHFEDETVLVFSLRINPELLEGITEGETLKLIKEFVRELVPKLPGSDWWDKTFEAALPKAKERATDPAGAEYQALLGPRYFWPRTFVIMQARDGWTFEFGQDVEQAMTRKPH